MNVEIQAETLQHLGESTSVRIRRRWSDTCISVLRAEYPTSTPVIDIAARLERSKAGIYGKARHLGLRRPVREKKRPDPVVVLNAPNFATADDTCPLVPSADNSAAVNSQVVLANETPPPAPASASIVCEGEIESRPYVRTQIGGRQSVWFAKVTERMMRLWLANVHHQVIPKVLGPQLDGQEVTAMAVQTKANRIGLPARYGITLIRDLDVASAIDRQAAPLPKTIRHQRQTLRFRVCPLSATPFYASNMNRLSNQAKSTLHYQNYNGNAEGMALGF